MEGKKALNVDRLRKNMKSLPKYYANVCTDNPPEYSDYIKSFVLSYGNIDKYEISRKIGRGRYADIYEGIRVEDGKHVAIKILRPIKKEKIKREVKIMQTLSKGPNIVQFVDLVKDPSTKTTSIIMEYADAKDTDFKLLYKKLTPADLKRYMFEALKALDYAHSMGIMHRDVKPHNLLYDIAKASLKVVDWGLAEFYFPGKAYHTRVAARFYKAPELLLENTRYDYSVDIWGLGCIFAAVLFQQEVFFQGKDDLDQLVSIAKVVGTDEIYDYVVNYGLKMPAGMYELLGKKPKKPWQKFKTVYNETYATDDAMNLLGKMLMVDHSKRITAKDAMAHPYFKGFT